jgi:hypothetical protein
MRGHDVGDDRPPATNRSPSRVRTAVARRFTTSILTTSEV